MEEVVRTATEATGGMSIQAFLGIIAALVIVITTLGEVIKAQVQKKTNPLNGVLVRLADTLGSVNTSLGKLDVRTEASNRVAETSSRVLAGHSEKLVLMSTAVAQLAANEAEQTKALLVMTPALEASLTGCTERITNHCNARSNAILTALDK